MASSCRTFESNMQMKVARLQLPEETAVSCVARTKRAEHRLFKCQRHARSRVCPLRHKDDGRHTTSRIHRGWRERPHGR